MARPVEFIKKHEARIIIFLQLAAKPLRHGRMICKKLNIDYAYVMKTLGGMYNKGWLITHKFEGVSYFKLSLQAPIIQAKDRLADQQLTLNKDGN